MGSAAIHRRLVCSARLASGALDIMSKSFTTSSPSIPSIVNRSLPFSSQDIVPAPVGQISYLFPGKSVTKRLVPIADFAERFPVFRKIIGNPLLKKDEDAVETSPEWQSVFGSFVSIGYCNLLQGVMAGPSFYKDNILIDPIFHHAHLKKPLGIRCDGHNGLNKSLTYGTITGLMGDIVQSFQPEVTPPRELTDLQALMGLPFIKNTVEELILFNPYFLDTSGYVALIYQLDHLLRRCYHNQRQVPGLAKARRTSLAKIASMKGQDGVTRWQDVVADDDVLNDRMHYICHDIARLTAENPTFDQMVWWGSIALGTARGELMHCWEPSVLKKLTLDPLKGLTMQNVVQHSRQRLPQLPSLGAKGLLDAGRTDDLGLRGFFPAHPLAHWRF